jgi:putative hemolysin
MLFDIFVVIGLILANAIFTISDMSVIASKKTRLNVLLEDGKKNASKVLKLVDDPTPIIATTQIGLTVITMLEGAFVEASLSGKVADYFTGVGYFAGYEHTAASVMVFFVVTFLLLLIGDILPKRIAILYPEAGSKGRHGEQGGDCGDSGYDKFFHFETPKLKVVLHILG